MKSGYFIFLVSILVINFLPPVAADTITPAGDDNYINNDTVINVYASPYNIDDSNNNGVLIINASNVVLDCNGSVFNGSLVSQGRAININGKENVTIKNCVVQNYHFGMRIYSNSHNTTLLYNTARYNTIGVYIEGSNKNNVSFNNMSFNSNQGLWLSGSDSNVSQNVFKGNNFGVYLYFCSSANLTWNNISGSTSANLVTESMFGNYVDKTNLVEGLPVYYTYNQDNFVLDENNATKHITIANADNVTIRNLDLLNGDFVHLHYVTNSSIENTAVEGGYYGLHMEYSDCNNITNNTFTSISSRGIYAFNSDNNSFSGNNATSPAGVGAYVQSSHWNTFDCNSFDFSGYGFYILASSNNTFSNSTADNNGYGIYVMAGSEGNRMYNITVDSSSKDAIYLTKQSSNFPQNNNFTCLAVANTNSSYYDIRFADEGINGTCITDTYLENYTFTGNGGTLNFRNGYGEIRFLEPINGSGKNLSADVSIGDNLVKVRSSNNPGLNRSANITLYSLPTSFLNPAILRDGFNCSESICCNFTPLNAGNVYFNVSFWTEYSVGEASHDISSCQTLDTEGGRYFLTQNISATGSCLEIRAHNITFDCQGFNITGNHTGDGINAYDVDNISVLNCKIYNFGPAAIYYKNSSFGLVEGCTVVNSSKNESGGWIGHGIVMSHGSSNSTVRNNTGINITMTAFIAIESGSKYNLFIDNYATRCGDQGVEIENGAHHNYVINNTMFDNNFGITLSPDTHNNLVRGNFINKTWSHGFEVYNSSDNLIGDNHVVNASKGINLGGNSSNNLIHNNTFTDFFQGAVFAGHGHYNNLTNNTITDCGEGVYFSSNSTDITVSGNTFSGIQNEIHLESYCSNITVFSNILTSKDSVMMSGLITWDNGFVGNRWTAYDQPLEGCQDADSNGICDSPYSLGGVNTDYLPIALVKGAVSSGNNGNTGSTSPGAGPPPAPECGSDSDCSYNQVCENESCVNITCDCGHIENHSCMAYECCSDSGCPSSHTCENHTCVLKEEVEDMLKLKNDTWEFIEYVEEFIQNKSEEEYSLMAARQLLQEAKRTYHEGNFILARNLSQEALDSIEYSGKYDEGRENNSLLYVIIICLVIAVILYFLRAKIFRKLK